MLSLSNAIRLMVLGGLFAVALVVVKACQPPPDAMDRFAVRSLSKLVQLDSPPVQPSLAFATPDGTTTLADHRGRVVLLNVWATWCPPCVAEMPSLERLAAERAGEDFVVLPVSLDRTMADAQAWYAKNGITRLPLIHDGEYRLFARLDLAGVPMSILYDRNGREVARLPGEADWASEEALALVDYLIAQ